NAVSRDFTSRMYSLSQRSGLERVRESFQRRSQTSSTAGTMFFSTSASQARLPSQAAMSGGSVAPPARTARALPASQAPIASRTARRRGGSSAAAARIRRAPDLATDSRPGRYRRGTWRPHRRPVDGPRGGHGSGGGG